MSAPNDTSALVGGPIKRVGGKALVAGALLPHFARARTYVEPCFGAGGMFFRVPEGTYAREAVNDLDASIVTFFRCLRDRTEDLVRVCEATPYSRAEFIAALEPSDDDIEEARRVWVRSRQGVSGSASSAGDWGRDPGDCHGWNPQGTERKLQALRAYAARLRAVSIDCIDAVEFIDKWGIGDTFAYVDAPYLPETRTGKSYTHEMTAEDHRRLAASCAAAVARGCKVAVSGYPSAAYSEWFAGWRTVSVDVPLYGTRDAKGQRRTEVLWCSYGPEASFAGIAAAQANARQPSLWSAK